MIINVRVGIGRNRSIPSGAEGIVMNVKRRHVANEGPCRLFHRGESANRQPDDWRSLRYTTQRAGAVVRRGDAGEALLDSLAILPARIAAKIVFVHGLR